MKKLQGKEGFLQYYRQLFTSQHEFESFLNALSIKRKPILRFSPEHAIKLKELWKDQGFEWTVLDFYENAVLWPESVPLGTILPGFTQGLLYPMNPSSLFPVKALELKPTDIVLDACAAPGGKSLAILDYLEYPNQLIANEISHQRANRMKQVFKQYGKETVQIQVKAAEKLSPHFDGFFDKVLIDAPCSSEQHVFNSPKHLKEWSTNRIKTLQKRQIHLISQLSKTLKPTGTLVYSTCAITPEENEVVVEAIVRQGKLNVLKPTTRIWPHLDDMDPMFVAIFGHR